MITAFIFLCLSSKSIKANNLECEVPLYVGHLKINSDNTGFFRQEINYIFKNDFDGQYLTFNKNTSKSKGFIIEQNPKILAYKNGKKVTIRSTIKDANNQYILKIYNKGQVNDKVKLIVTWKVHNILSHYQDIAVLDWTPIAYWNQEIKKVNFEISTEKESHLKDVMIHRGLFQESNKISKGTVFKLTSKDVNGTYRIRAYWDSHILAGKAEAKKSLTAFKKEEAKLRVTKKWTYLFVNYFSYGIIICTIGLAFYSWLLFKKSVKSYSLKSINCLESLPKELSPLALAHSIYRIQLEDLNPVATNSNKEGIDFTSIIYSSLLDLLERKQIRLSREKAEVYLIRNETNNLADFELALLEMIFTNQKKILLIHVFSSYIFDDNFIEELKETDHGISLQIQINAEGLICLKKLEKHLKKISRLLTKYQKENQNKLFRPLSNQEKKYWLFNRIFLIIAIGGLIFFGLFLMSKGKTDRAMINLSLALITFLLIFMNNKEVMEYQLLGVLTEEGKLACDQWHDFCYLLKTSEGSKKASLTADRRWRRLIVYASLFGMEAEAKNYLSKNQIDIKKSEFGLIYSEFSQLLNQQTQALKDSQVKAFWASRYTVVKE